MKNVRVIAALVSALLPVAGCGAADPSMTNPSADAATPADAALVDGGTPAQSACAWSDFAADVRRGPSAGAHMAGALTLAQVDATTLRGTFVSPGGAPVAVRGELAGRAITLRFATAAGAMTGTGTLASDFARCPVPFRGDLTGPRDGDVGDWNAGIVDVSPRCFSYEGTDGPAVSCFNGRDMRCVCISPPRGRRRDVRLLPGAPLTGATRLSARGAAASALRSTPPRR